MIKKFIATNVEMAQAKANRALGDGVIVLNIRDLPSGDIELTAGNEQDAREYYRANPDHQTQNQQAQQDQSFASDKDHQGAYQRNEENGFEDPRAEGFLSEEPVAERSGTENSNNEQNNDEQNNDEQKPRPRKNLFPFFSKKSEPAPEKIAPTADQGINPQEPSPQDTSSGDTSSGDTNSSDTYSTDTGPRDENTLNTPLNALPNNNLEAEFIDDRQEGSNSLNHPAPYEENRTPPFTKTPAMPQGNQPSNNYGPSQGSRLNEPLEKKFSENALSQLRERLTGQQNPDENFHDDPTTQSLVNILKPHGISDRLLSMILNGARKAQVDDDLYRMGIGFAESFNFSPLRSSASVPIMLVGPTGAGKTSCAAKLAALALSQGESAVMITTDVGRAGALEQFATYSEKLEIECYAAETPEEIVTIMREANPNGAVILDTPGISPYDAGDLAALKSYQTAIGAEPILVLPASGDVGEYTDWAHAFRAFGVRSCIITKFDATRRVGAGLSAAFEGDMTLTYFSETPFISEGLLPASPEFLAYRLMANYPGRIVQN